MPKADKPKVPETPEAVETPEVEPVTESEDTVEARKAEAALPSVEELHSQLAKVKELEAKIIKELSIDRRPVVPDSTPLPSDGRKASEATEEEIERAQILRDPYATKVSTRILRHPPGKHLDWISPRACERKGSTSGFTPVTKDDAIGREIHRYIDMPPMRMAGKAESDNYIWRGDVILAWIDEGIWQKRLMNVEAEAARRLGAQKSQRSFGRHGSTFEEGLKRDEKPYQERRLAPGFVPQDTGDYLNIARGTVEDASIAVPRGRPMFEEIDDDS